MFLLILIMFQVGLLINSPVIHLARKKDIIKYMNYQVAGDLAAAVIFKDSNSLLTERDVVEDVASKWRTSL